MNKHYFHQLLTHYRSGNCTEQEKRLVEQWFALIDGNETPHSHQENKQLEDRIWNAIQRDRQSTSPFTGKVLPLRVTWRWMAAAVFIVALWGGYQLKQSSRSVKESIGGQLVEGMVSEKNNTAKPFLITFRDGTTVHLLPKSSIEYRVRFGAEKREVYLKGKAFFHVAKDAEHPFFVYTGAVATKVLGTSFWVEAADDSSDVEVSVVTGKVSVFRHNADEADTGRNSNTGVILIPNQRVCYTSENQSFVTGLVSEPVMLDSYAGAFVFSDTPLTKVADLLEKAYGIEIVLENEQLEKCLFTADINKQPLFTKLDLISSSVNANYKVVGTKIVLSGKGCGSN